tara:strand:+ start:1305 stop:1631 length:327 start_codon:yes stop_codon:yes gene_type:complete
VAKLVCDGVLNVVGCGDTFAPLDVLCVPTVEGEVSFYDLACLQVVPVLGDGDGGCRIACPSVGIGDKENQVGAILSLLGLSGAGVRELQERLERAGDSVPRLDRALDL